MMSLNFGQSSQLNLWSIDKKRLSAPTEQRFTTMPSLDFEATLSTESVVNADKDTEFM